MGRKIERRVGDAGTAPPSALAREIDENLRRVYREVLEEGVPDRFTELLAQLKAKAADPNASGGEGGMR